jgi:hypothetical protein
MDIDKATGRRRSIDHDGELAAVLDEHFVRLTGWKQPQPENFKQRNKFQAIMLSPAASSVASG